MIWHAPMGSICWPSNPGSKSNEDTAFIQYIDGWDPHIHKIWCLVLENINCEVHPTAQVEVIPGTVREFVTDYPAGNGRRIQIIGKFSVNNSVQFLGVPNQGGGSVLPFI